MWKRLWTPDWLWLLTHQEIISNINYFLENWSTVESLCQLLWVSPVSFQALKNKNQPISETMQARCTILFKYNPDTKQALFKIQSDNLKEKIQNFLKNYPNEEETVASRIHGEKPTKAYFDKNWKYILNHSKKDKEAMKRLSKK